MNQMIEEQDAPLKLLQLAYDRPIQTMILMAETQYGEYIGNDAIYYNGLL